MQPRVFSKERPLQNEIDALILLMECSAKTSISLDELLDYSHTIGDRRKK